MSPAGTVEPTHPGMGGWLGRPRVRAGLWVLGLVLGVMSLNAGEFRLTEARTNYVEGGEIRYLLLEAAGQRFGFLPPAGWSARAIPSREVVELWETNRSARIQIQVEALTEAPEGESLATRLKESAAEEYPAAKRVREWSCTSGCGPGLGVDLLQPVRPGLQTAYSIAWVPVKHALLKFELRSSQHLLAVHGPVLRQVVGSFRDFTTVR